MAIHDAYARLTPFELLLPDPDFPDRHFPGIGEEAGERGTDPRNPAAFVMLGAVQGALSELREDDADPQSAHDHGSVLFFAYHMWLAGAAVTLVRADTLRTLLTPPAETGDGWTARLHDRAGYVQLPQHLVWIEEGDAGGPGEPSPPDPARPHPSEPAGDEGQRSGSLPAPESADGFFWAVDGRGIVHITLVTGMRSDRPGYVIVPVPPQPLDSLPAWAAGPAREGGGDFTTSLPGAELDGLLGIRTPAEVFKLGALVLQRIAREDPAEGSPAPAASPEASPEATPRSRDPAPRPSALPSATL